MQQAKVLDLEQAKARAESAPRPEVHERITGNSRAIAVAKFRELADKLEGGELDGARVQWRRCRGEELSGESEMQVVTVQADADYRVGTVQLRTTTIEEG